MDTVNTLKNIISKLEIENIILKKEINILKKEKPIQNNQHELECYKIHINNLYFEIDNLCAELENYEFKIGNTITLLKNTITFNNSIDLLTIKPHLVKSDKFNYFINNSDDYIKCYEERFKRSSDSYYNYKYIGYFDNTHRLNTENNVIEKHCRNKRKRIRKWVCCSKKLT